MATAALPQMALNANVARPSGSVIPRSDFGAQWKKMNAEGQGQVYAQLEEARKKG